MEHFSALPIGDLGVFLAAIRTEAGVGAKALEFLILTATRTSEVLGCQWSEINLKEKIWIIPAIRMKAKKEHRVPLSHRAIEILESMPSFDFGPFVFPGQKVGQSPAIIGAAKQGVSAPLHPASKPRRRMKVKAV